MKKRVSVREGIKVAKRQDTDKRWYTYEEFKAIQHIAMLANGASKCEQGLCEHIMKQVVGELGRLKGKLNSQDIGMLANGASKCGQIVKDEIKAHLEPILKSCSIEKGDKKSNCVIESMILIGIRDRDEEIKAYLRDQEQVDLHEFNPDNLKEVLNWISFHQIDVQGYIYGRATHSRCEVNRMKEELTGWLSEKGIEFDIEVEGCLRIRGRE